MVGQSLSRMVAMKALVVFSHLRWNFVYQRPQHLLSRLAQRWPVIFIEEPVPGAGRARLEQIAAGPGVTVWRPHVRGAAHGFHADHKAVMQRLLAQAMREHQLKDYWIWFYTPMALPLAEHLSPDGIIYDCMDELSAFKNAPQQLLDQEAELLRISDVVFTGGRSLYNAKRHRHANIHCFPSSVDAMHFRRAQHDHPKQAHLGRPRLGYCGVIDERIDLDLIAGMADARPDWEIVMVGPVVKIDPASTPQRSNIHYLGQQGYDDLPAFISGWDVCLLPFALNESTRFISPTKTLEYMACGRPSVSTRIRDVVEPYGHVVPIHDDAQGFVHACEAALRRSPQEQAAHAEQLAAIIARTSWDATATAMAELIAEAEVARNGDDTVRQAPRHGTSLALPEARAAAGTAAVAG